MKRVLAILTVLVLLAAGVAPQGTEGGKPPEGAAVRFSSVDVCVDSGAQPLAAYQLELAAEVGDVKIVGIEGGEHAAFKEPPYYDPAAIRRDHVILAAFSTDTQLPKGNTRVARVHVQITGDGPPQYAVKLNVAASTDGNKTSAKASLNPQGEPK
jgi:hypothetical protein